MLQMFKKDFFKQQHQKQNMRTIVVLLPLFSW